MTSPHAPDEVWSASRVAEIAIRQVMHRVRRVGLAEHDVLPEVTRAVARADAVVATGIVRSPRTYRWRAAQNALRNLVPDEQRRQTRVRRAARAQNGTVGSAKRGKGGWRQAWTAWRIQTPEEVYAAKELAERLLTAEQLRICVLHVAQKKSLDEVARILHKRKAVVSRLWKQAQAALRGAA
jgi:hypothetical protein